MSGEVLASSGSAGIRVIGRWRGYRLFCLGGDICV